MFRPTPTIYELPLVAFTNEVKHFLDENPDPAQCPFSDHFEKMHLHNPAAYTNRTPELQSNTEEYRTITDRTYDIQRLLHVASMDTRRIYRPAFKFLSEQWLSDDQTLTVLRNSLPMAHHYASVKASDAREIAKAARATGETFRNVYDKEGTLTSINFTSEFIRDQIHPLRARKFGCSLLGVVLVSPHDGKRYNAYDFYWDAMVVEADRRRRRIAAQTRSTVPDLAQ